MRRTRRGCYAAFRDGSEQGAPTIGAIRQDLSTAGMAAAIEANWTGMFEQWGRSSRVELHDEARDLRWYAAPGVPVAIFNHAYFTRLAQEEDVDARIEAVVGGFAEREVPFMWSVGPFTQPTDLGSRLEAHGLAHAEELPGMAVDLRTFNEDASFPSALTVERVIDEETLRECLEVQRVAFGAPEFTAEVSFDVCTAVGVGDESPWRNYVGRLEGEAVAASQLVLAAGVAGIHSVVTLPKARRQGLGAALTLAALHEARELGYRIGVLQSSAMGLNVYRRLGFEQYGTYRIYAGSAKNNKASRG